MAGRLQIDSTLGQLEELWGYLDTLFDAIEATGEWGHKHGPDWTFADVPYHLAYFDQQLIGRGLELGPDYPQAEQERYITMAEVNVWNAREFAKRAPGQTARESVAQARAVRDQIRRLVVGLDDDGMQRPFYLPLLGMGWINTGTGLTLAVVHNWSEFTQLRIHMGRAEPVPSAGATNTYLGTIVGFMAMSMDKQAAHGLDFTVVYDFTDSGVSPVTFQVHDGAANVTLGRAQHADLVITESADTFEKVLRGIESPMDVMQSGAMRVSNMEALGTFGKLFPTGESIEEKVLVN
jgi:hypothetical protein